ncbi:MAG: beta strand repeat-containing protein [Planctomycetota bacterium]
MRSMPSCAATTCRATLSLLTIAALTGSLAAQSTWTGATSADWNDASNWSSSSVPTSSDDVVVPPVVAPAFEPATSGAPACRDLTVQVGGRLTLSPLVVLGVHGNVTVDGDVADGGSLELRGGNAASVAGAAALPTLVVDKAPGTAVSLNGSPSIAGAFTLRDGALSVAGTATFALPASFVGGSLTNQGSYRFESSVAFTGTAVGAAPQITVLGDWQSDASFQPTSGAVVFDGSSTLSGAPSFFDLVLDIGNPTQTEVFANVPTTVRGGLTVRGGATLFGNQQVTVTGAASIEAAGTFDTAGGTHRFASSITQNGTIAGNGTFTCVGSTAGTIAASQPLPAVVVQKNGVTNLTFAGGTDLEIDGTLTLNSGILRINRTTRVVGVSTFAGGSLTGNSLLDLDDDANFVGASVTLPPAITCSGDWLADSFYDPASGTVTFDGTPGTSQTIDLSGASFGNQTNFYVINVAAGASVTALSELRVRNSMTVSGQFTAAAPMDHDGSFHVTANAVCDAGAFTHTFAGTVDLDTAITVAGTGVFVFDGSTSASLVTPTTVAVTVPNVRVVKTGGASLWVGYLLTIDGSLELLSGRLTGQSTTTVTGDATFSGGHLGTTPSTGYGLVVDGDVVCNGAVAVHPPTITVRGNWTSDDLWAPQDGAVRFEGTNPQVMTSTVGPLRFAGLEVEFGASASTQEQIECQSLAVDGAFTTTAAIDCDGALTVGAQGTLGAGAATHRIAANMTATGNLIATGVFVFDGSSAGSISSSDPLPAVRIEKDASAVCSLVGLTIIGDLDMLSGHVRTGNSTTGVQGDARFQGGQISYTTMVVGGDVTFSGCQSIANPSAQPWVNLTCEGDFFGHPAFRPISGTITMDSDGATLSGALELFSLSLPTNSSADVLSPLTLAGSLSLSGELDLFGSDQPMEVVGATTFGAGGSLRFGDQTYRFGGSLDATAGNLVRKPGTLLEFFGPSNATVSHNQQVTLPPVRIAKDGTAWLSVGGTVTIDGDLELVSGQLSVSSQLHVDGDATFRFGILSGGPTGSLEVIGDTTFEGALVVTPPNIKVFGDWTADALFQPTTRTVTFAGAGTTQNVLGSEGRFHALQLAISANVVSNVPIHVAADLAITSAVLQSNHPSDMVVLGSLANTGTLGVAAALRVGGNLTTSSSMSIGDELEVGGDIWVQSGTLSLGDGRFGGGLQADGGFASTGTVRFTGATSETVSSAAPLPTLTVDKSAASTLTLASVDITGDLVLANGTISASGTTVVAGEARFEGGSVSGGGTIDVAGDITFAGALGYAPPNFVCGGDFTTSSEFRPFSGTVTLNGTSGQQILGADAQFHSLVIETLTVVSSAVDLHFTGDVVHNGILWTTTGDLDCDGNFTSNNSWDVGGGTHRFAGALTLQGSVSNATGEFVLDGPSSNATVQSTQPLPALRIERQQQVTLSNLTVTGDLDLELGRLIVSGTVNVGGDVTLHAGELAGGGLLQVVGDFTSQGAFTTAPPTIRLAGDWTADQDFAPQGGLVTFLGSTPQALSATAGALRFYAVEVANGAALVATEPVTIGHTLLVNGDLTTSSTLDVASTVTSNTESELHLGAGAHRFAGSLNLGGVVDATGSFEFYNPTTSSVAVTAAVPIPAIVKTGAGTLTLNAGVVVAGGVDVARGRFRYGNPVVVQGDAVFRGGDLDSGSVLDVAGDVTFLGATATSPGTIRCAGNWSSESNFTPPNGVVELTGNGTIASLTPNQAASFHLLDVSGGARQVVGDIAVRGTTMTIATNADLIIGANASLTLERAAMTVNGELQLLDNGQLLLGEPASVRVDQLGRLRLLGAGAASRVRIDAIDGGGYGFVVEGFVAARDFEFFRPDEHGFVIESTATVDQSAAQGFRNGTFDFPRNVPGAVLLDVDPPTNPPVALLMQNMAFQNTAGAQNVHNVRVTQGETVTLVNATGAFAGETFEDDPLGDRIDWTSGQLSILGSFAVLAGAGEATVAWSTIDESTIASFTLDRQQLEPTPGSFGNALVFNASGVPSNYQQLVTGLVPGVSYRFRLRERETPTSALTTIATADVTPFSGGAPVEVFEVGASAAYPDVQSAITAALASGLPAPVVRIGAGSYDSFVVNGAPAQGLRIVGDGSGPVFVSTAVTGPVTVQNVPFGRFVELGDVTIGSPSSPQAGVLVTASAGLVLLDEVSVDAGAPDALIVENSTAVVVQGPNTSVQSAGGDGLSVRGVSACTASNANFSTVYVQATAQLTHGAINVVPTLEAGAGETVFAGLVPVLSGERFPVLAQPLQYQFEGFPSSLWLLVMSENYSFPISLFEMPVLVDLGTLMVAHTGVTDAAGVATHSLFLPANGNLIGLSRVFQAASVNLGTGQLRLSNAQGVTILAGN